MFIFGDGFFWRFLTCFFTKSLFMTQAIFLFEKFIPKRDLAYLLEGSNYYGKFWFEILRITEVNLIFVSL